MNPPTKEAKLREALAARADAEGLLDVAYTTADSPFGPLLLATTERGLVRVGLPTQDGDELLEELARRVSPRVLEAPAKLDEARRELDLYFEGRLREFDLPLDWRLSRDFRRRVLRAIARIPYGKTRTYTEVATSAGNERAVRAAGHRLRLQPAPDRRPLPPRPAQRRRPRRLRRGAADEGSAAEARGRAGRITHWLKKSAWRVDLPTMRQPVPSPRPAQASRLTGLTAALALLALLCLATPAHSLTIVLAPTIDTAITDGPAEGAAIEIDRPTFAFSATRDGQPFPDATFHCSVDSAPAQPCTSPIMIGPLEEGSHSFSVYASDPQSFTADPEPAGGRSRSSKKTRNARNSKTKKASSKKNAKKRTRTPSCRPKSACCAAPRRASSHTPRRTRCGWSSATPPSPPPTSASPTGCAAASGGLHLGPAKQRFAKKGTFRTIARLTESQMEKVRAAKRLHGDDEHPRHPRATATATTPGT